LTKRDYTDLLCPFHEVFLTRFNEGCDGDTELVTPRISLLHLDLCWEPFIHNSLARVLTPLLRLPTRVLFPISAILGEESLKNEVSG